MSKEQIDEMAEIIGAVRFHNISDYIAEKLYNAGYRKQSEGSNISGYPSLFECSVCHWQDSDTCMADTSEFNYCPNCGARMKGENK